MFYGGKNSNGTYQTIINCLPPHKIYIEPFLGSGAIIKNKKLAEYNEGCELNPETIKKFHKKPPYQVFNSCGISHMNHVSKQCTAIGGKDILIYADPPYRVSSKRTKKPGYEFDFTEADHIRFLDTALLLTKKNNVKICISHLPDELYNKTLKGWSVLEYQNIIRGGTQTECLYMNYPLPVELFDYSFVGNDFVRRQQIKRIMQRMVKKLNGLPALERNAIINHIINEYSCK